MITFKINQTPYKFPTCWADVTYSQYVALIESRTLTDHIHIFTGIPKETLENAELRNLENVSIALSFLSFTPKFDRTKAVGPYALPEDVTIQSVGQFEDLRGLLLKMPKDPMSEPEMVADLYLHACAIYCQKLRDEKYNWIKTFEVKDELKNYSCAEVIGTGAFFLFKPLNLSPSTTKVFPTLTQRMRKSIQDFPGYQKTSAFLQRCFGLAAK